MPDKEGAEEKTTKDVVTKRQKQLMNKEEYVQEMPDDVKNIMMKGLRKGAGEFSKGGDPKNIIKKGVKSTIKNVIKSKSVQNFLNNEYIPEEGYDVARDQGRVKPSKDKKDATTMPPSKEMEKTRKVNKGPSALDRVKAKYGKSVMNIGKKKANEELDLTKVAEAFGGYIVEANGKKKKPKPPFDPEAEGFGGKPGTPPQSVPPAPPSKSTGGSRPTRPPSAQPEVGYGGKAGDKPSDLIGEPTPREIERQKFQVSRAEMQRTSPTPGEKQKQREIVKKFIYKVEKRLIILN